MVCTFGFHRRWVRRCECETDMPKPGPLPQTSQWLATMASSKIRERSIGSPTGNPRSVASPAGSDQTGRVGSRVTPGRSAGGSPGRMLDVLDASAVRRWSHAAAETLAAHRDEINDLNVYPIADGDAGTNLTLTLRSAAEAVSGDRTAGAGSVLRAMAQGAVLGAQGNSGGIIAQVLCGLADGFDGLIEADGAALVAGLRSACDAAYAAVPEPVEGTMLTVARAAADAAGQLTPGTSLDAVATAAVGAAVDALRHTPEQLDVLAKAGVVDAGGQGLVLLLAELAGVISGAPVERAPVRPVPRNRAALEIAREAGSAEFGYEVQYLLHAEKPALAGLRASLGELGDSLLVVGTGSGLYNVHVHVNDVG